MSGTDGGAEVLKVLVDSLTNTLSRIAARQETTQRDIERCSDKLDKLTEVESLVKVSGENMEESKRSLASIKSDVVSIGAEIVSIKKSIETMKDEFHAACLSAQAGLGAIDKKMGPIAQITELMRRPIAWVVAIILFVTAVFSSYELGKKIKDFFISAPHTHSVQPVPGSPTNSPPQGP